MSATDAHQRAAWSYHPRSSCGSRIAGFTPSCASTPSAHMRFARIPGASSVTYWLRRWREVPDSGPEIAMEVLTSTAPEASELRQNSRFAGVLAD